MKIGIGLPAAIPHTPGSLILEWARQAEAGPFSSLSVIDRVVYPNYDPLVTLAAVAGITSRVRLMTTVLIAPTRPTAMLAKQCASIDALSNGRLTLGLGIGNREDDYTATSSSFHDRGKRLDEQLDLMTRIWSGQTPTEGTKPIGPQPARSGGPEVLIGGYSSAAIKRIKRWGDGFIAGSRDPQSTDHYFRLVEETWREGGRAGKPRLVGCAYFALGPDAPAKAQPYILDYYAFAAPVAERLLSTLPTTAEAVRATVKTMTDLGADELTLWPCIPELDQIARLADLVS